MILIQRLDLVWILLPGETPHMLCLTMHLHVDVFLISCIWRCELCNFSYKWRVVKNTKYVWISASILFNHKANVQFLLSDFKFVWTWLKEREREKIHSQFYNGSLYPRAISTTTFFTLGNRWKMWPKVKKLWP